MSSSESDSPPPLRITKFKEKTDISQCTAANPPCPNPTIDTDIFKNTALAQCRGWFCGLHSTMISNLYAEYKVVTEEYKTLLQRSAPRLSSSKRLGANAETIAYIGYYKEKLRALGHLLLIREAIVNRCLGESRNVIVWRFCKSYDALLLKWTTARGELEEKEELLYPKEVAEKVRGQNTHTKVDPARVLAVRSSDYTDIPNTSDKADKGADSWKDYTWAHSRVWTTPMLGAAIATYLDPSTYHSEWSKDEHKIALLGLALSSIRTMYANPAGYWQGHCGRYKNFYHYLERRSVEDADIDDYTPDLWNLFKGLRELDLQNLKDSLEQLFPGKTLGIDVFLGSEIRIPDSTAVFERLSWKVFYKISGISITDAFGICRTFEQMQQLYVFEAFGFLSFWEKKGLLVGRGSHFYDLVMRGFLCLTTGPCSESIMALLSVAAGVTLNMFQKRYWMLGFMSKETTSQNLNDLVKGFGGNIDIIVVDPLSKTAKNVSFDGTLWLPTSKLLPAKQDIWGTRRISDHLEFKPLMEEVKKVFISYHLDSELMDFSEFKIVIMINRLHNKPITFGTLAGTYTLREVFDVGMHAMQKYMTADDFEDFTSYLNYSHWGPISRMAGNDTWSRGENFQERWFISNLLLSLVENGHLVKLSEDTPKPLADIRVFVKSDPRDFPVPHFWIKYPKHSEEPSPHAKFADKRRRLNGIGRRKGSFMTVLALDLPDFWYPTSISPSLAFATRFTDSDGAVYEWRRPPCDYPGSADAWCAALCNLFELNDGIYAVYDRIYIITWADDEHHDAKVRTVRNALLAGGVYTNVTPYTNDAPSSWTTNGIFKDFDPADECRLGRYIWRGCRKTKEGKWLPRRRLPSKKHECYAARYLDVVKDMLSAMRAAVRVEMVSRSRSGGG